MMKLALMRRFFDTVDQRWASPLADQIAARWVAPGAKVRVLRASANFICRVEEGGRVSFLRFNHAGERRAEEIGAELDFIRHVTARGIRAARPLPSLAGKLVESVPTELGTFHAVLFEALPGVEREFDELDLAGFERWGQALGQLHCASADFTSPERPGWAQRLAFARREIPAVETAAQRELDRVEAELALLPAAPVDFGMIHYDFEQDNLCWQGDAIGSLDYDDCGPYWYAADIAYALRDLFHDRPAGVNPGEPRLQAFLRGYRSARPLGDEWLARLPLFLRLHNLVAYARITRSLGSGPQPDEPVWLGGLRGKLESFLEGYRGGWIYPDEKI
jgi:Ser/Thr protein kinase RdoA (MazF antagonist)